MPQQLLASFLRWPLLSRVFLIATFVVVFFGVVIHFIEPQSFPTMFDGIWWAIITTSTIGYGDFVPTTFIGRLVGIILIVVGAGFVSSYFVTLAATTFTTQNAFLEGKMSYKLKGHLIIIGWNERSREIMDEFCHLDKEKEIILIDDSLEEVPIKKANIHFVKGRANRDEVLHKANILSADKVLITADPNKNELDSDMNSILTLLTIKGIRQDLFCEVEILTSEQVLNAQRAGADEIIQTNVLSSFAMMNGILNGKRDESLLYMLNQLRQSRFTFLPIEEQYVDKTFELVSILLLKHGTLLIGIKRGEETFINPPLSFKIKADDIALCILKTQA